VFAVVSFWSLYLLRSPPPIYLPHMPLTTHRGNTHGPPLVRSLSQRLSRRFTPWQSVVITLLWLYVCRNFAKIVGLESPEPLANLYNRAYFRATWITTALDAGFWSAMRIKNKAVRDIASIVFTVYYLIAAEQADEKVRKVRAVLTVDHLRVSWNKGTTPYLYWITSLMRPTFTKYRPRRIRIPRPRGSSYKEPVNAWMYFDGTLAELEQQANLVLDIPGGGFVAMSPRESDDKLLAWAGKTGLPILSIDYRKAPEHPYPYALNECFDVYTQIIATKGRCIGMKPAHTPRVVITGDSAGGNLATGTVLMIIQSQISASSSSSSRALPIPSGLVLLYPALDMNIGSWMTDDQLNLIRNPRTAKRHEYSNFIARKSEDIDQRYTPSTPRPHDTQTDDFFSSRPQPQRTDTITNATATVAAGKPQPLKTRLAVSSIISYFSDRILTPEMMRAMIILYVGPHTRPDFTTDHLLCPAVAPESLLARFPKTYLLTGERDPLVDDTVIFAGRLRQAKLHVFNERKEVGLEKSGRSFNEKEHVEVSLIPGISHGFIQFVSIFPEGWRHVFRAAGWINDIFDRTPDRTEPGYHRSLGVEAEGEGVRGEGEGEDVNGNGYAYPGYQQDLELGLAQANGKLNHHLNHSRQPHHQRTPTGGSEDEEVLVMKGPPKPGNGKGNGKANGHAKSKSRTMTIDTGLVRSPSPEERRLARTKSMLSLGSEEDLLKRRMKGLTVGLMGMNE
jgi:acetyl esterase/lipase